MPAGKVRPLASQVQQALRDRIGAAVEVWLLASALLHAPQPVSEPYPHICGQEWTPGGRRVGRRDCAACGEAAGARQDRVTGALAVPERPPEAARAA